MIEESAGGILTLFSDQAVHEDSGDRSDEDVKSYIHLISMGIKKVEVVLQTQ